MKLYIHIELWRIPTVTIKEKVLEEKDPPQTWRAVEIFKGIPQRFLLLMWKGLSWKGVFTTVYILGVLKGVVPQEHIVWGFLVLFLLVVFDKQGLQVLKDLKK
jgi:hypothetical protein